MRSFVHVITAQPLQFEDRGDRQVSPKPADRTSRRRFPSLRHR
ncbi:MAG TPA: hypothetical protein VID76_04380 [Solirubrobacterales bacterium]|jgi:hypothetical protein